MVLESFQRKVKADLLPLENMYTTQWSCLMCVLLDLHDLASRGLLTYCLFYSGLAEIFCGCFTSLE
jgi:hypothetical protein